jgi:hypothetical protein
MKVRFDRPGKELHPELGVLVPGVAYDVPVVVGVHWARQGAADVLEDRVEWDCFDPTCGQKHVLRRGEREWQCGAKEPEPLQTSAQAEHQALQEDAAKVAGNEPEAHPGHEAHGDQE